MVAMLEHLKLFVLNADMIFASGTESSTPAPGASRHVLLRRYEVAVSQPVPPLFAKNWEPIIFFLKQTANICYNKK